MVINYKDKRQNYIKGFRYNEGVKPYIISPLIALYRIHSKNQGKVTAEQPGKPDGCNQNQIRNHHADLQEHYLFSIKFSVNIKCRKIINSKKDAK